jgi:hypothetical protein
MTFLLKKSMTPVINSSVAGQLKLRVQMFQKIKGDWVKVADADVTATSHEVTYDFTPTVVGDDVYEFRLSSSSIFSNTFCMSFNSS